MNTCRVKKATKSNLNRILSKCFLICHHSSRTLQQITFWFFSVLQFLPERIVDLLQHKEKRTFGTATMQRATHALHSEPRCTSRLRSGIILYHLLWRKARAHPHKRENCWTHKSGEAFIFFPSHLGENLGSTCCARRNAIWSCFSNNKAEGWASQRSDLKTDSFYSTTARKKTTTEKLWCYGWKIMTSEHKQSKNWCLKIHSNPLWIYFQVVC